jgi:hypothetical protein
MNSPHRPSCAKKPGSPGKVLKVTVAGSSRRSVISRKTENVAFVSDALRFISASITVDSFSNDRGKLKTNGVL